MNRVPSNADQKHKAEPVSEADLLRVTGLSVRFGHHQRLAVDDIGFRLAPKERLGIIGESGSGKSVTALSILGLLPETAQLTGSVLFRGEELIGKTDRELSAVRGDGISMIFQEPMTALDPTMRVGQQVGEVLRLHTSIRGGDMRSRIHRSLEEVGIQQPERVAKSFPHTLSGGQRQRVLIAMAIINQPALVICDEPTTALDVTVQKKVLGVLDRSLEQSEAACIFISHDLAVVSQLCTSVAVMLDGKIVERGPIEHIINQPQHWYTKGLIATARLDDAEPGQRLPTVDDFRPDSPTPVPAGHVNRGGDGNGRRN